MTPRETPETPAPDGRGGPGGGAVPPGTAVVALGGNALLPRGEAPEAAAQLRAARLAAETLAPAAAGHRLVVTHGNGPQVGLLALMNDAYGEVDPYPLDVLDAESAGQIGYVIELELDNAIDGCDTVALITRVVVREDDPAFADPGKFIGPLYDEASAGEIGVERGWTIKRDGEGYRRVVPSPEPQSIVQLSAIRRLSEAGFLVVCAGGGGIPVIEEGAGHRGVEAVIDKDLCSARLAIDLEAELLVLATDVDAVYLDWEGPDRRAIGKTTPSGLRRNRFPAGSMGPKVEAACRMVEATGGRAAIGSLQDLEGLIDGSRGTQVSDDSDPAHATDNEKGG
ncbi:MAG: carbamate kinase [Thermoleophilia bacterium]|nr:carbamate kinase [Thermoleophilia bacterium]